MERTEYVYHNSIENCIERWGDNPNGYGCPAGKSAAKALKALGMSRNEGEGARVYIRTTPSDGYSLFVKDTATAEKVATEVLKDTRVVSVTVNGNPFTPKTNEELEAFKRQVYKKAMEKARQHDWCHVVQDTLKELGIEAPKKRLKVVMEMDVEDDDTDDKTVVRERIYDLNRTDLFEAIKSIETIEA